MFDGTMLVMVGILLLTREFVHSRVHLFIAMTIGTITIYRGILKVQKRDVQAVA